MSVCGNCKHFMPFPALPGGQKPAYDGECHESPPQAIPSFALTLGATGICGIYPPVMKDVRGCGRHEKTVPLHEAEK